MTQLLPEHFQLLIRRSRSQSDSPTPSHPSPVQERRDTEQHPGVLAVRPEGPLFYANTERLEVTGSAGLGPRHVCCWTDCHGW